MYDVVGCGRGILNIDPHQVCLSEIFLSTKYISVLQANMKVHSQGCMEVLTHHMRDNITTLVGLIVATLFLQVILKKFNF